MKRAPEDIRCREQGSDHAIPRHAHQSAPCEGSTCSPRLRPQDRPTCLRADRLCAIPSPTRPVWPNHGVWHPRLGMFGAETIIDAQNEPPSPARGVSFGSTDPEKRGRIARRRRGDFTAIGDNWDSVCGSRDRPPDVSIPLPCAGARPNMIPDAFGLLTAPFVAAADRLSTSDHKALSAGVSKVASDSSVDGWSRRIRVADPLCG